MELKEELKEKVLNLVGNWQKQYDHIKDNFNPESDWGETKDDFMDKIQEYINLTEKILVDSNTIIFMFLKLGLSAESYEEFDKLMSKPKILLASVLDLEHLDNKKN